MEKEIALSIEQMQHLESLGLDTSDASMFYLWNDYKSEYESIPIFVLNTEEQKEWLSSPIGRKSLYTYNLQDILDILSNSSLEWRMTKYGLYLFKPILEELLWGICGDMLDNGYNAVLWCIENNYIKTNKV